MKRDMDLIRRIVLATAELPHGEVLSGLPDVDQATFATHVVWLGEANLVVAMADLGTGSYATFANVQRLTWAGCDFADAVVNDTLWNKAKDKVIKPGMSFTFDLLKEWLKAEIAQGLPSLR
ncbi:DUF2513 domain-containing protein [Acidovorax delafieldii]|uniref:DUF2513 domain-containing protein n=1 Tax=Acidovorax delafieldii TaxID=47920 RepID=UPI003ED0BAF0